jgi:hypothetical protein
MDDLSITDRLQSATPVKEVRPRGSGRDSQQSPSRHPFPKDDFATEDADDDPIPPDEKPHEVDELA